MLLVCASLHLLLAPCCTSGSSELFEAGGENQLFVLTFLTPSATERGGGAFRCCSHAATPSRRRALLSGSLPVLAAHLGRCSFGGGRGGSFTRHTVSPVPPLLSWCGAITSLPSRRGAEADKPYGLRLSTSRSAGNRAGEGFTRAVRDRTFCFSGGVRVHIYCVCLKLMVEKDW